MRVQGDDRKLIYSIYEEVYRKYISEGFKWKKGEKGKALKVFILFCEALNYRDDSEFKEAGKLFIDYCEEEGNNWIRWQDSNRNNYLGYLTSTTRIKNWAATKKAKSEEKKATNLTIVGVKSNDEWDF